MTLAEAGAEFLEQVKLSESSPASLHPSIHKQAFETLTAGFSARSDVREVSATKLRGRLSRSYVEKAFASGSYDPDDAAMLIDSLAKFFDWLGQRDLIDSTSDVLRVLAELRKTLPRSLEITRELSSLLKAHRGAFNFPEFLTSFEQGGRNQYDIDAPGDAGALEGFFRIIRVAGSFIEAYELISEENVTPILFPGAVLSELDAGYIINLELVKSPEGWVISDCGVVYPPGTDVLGID